MSETRTTTPGWLPHLMGALLTVGATWTAIRQEVPGIVQAAVQAEVQSMSVALMDRQDSAWKQAQVQLHQRIHEEAGAVRDSLRAALNLVRSDQGRVTYAPNIIVQPDTAGNQALLAMMDSLASTQADILRRLAASGAIPEPKGRKPQWIHRR